MLWDTGPLVAMFDRDDPYYERCVQVLEHLPKQTMVTTWPCLTEAMHLLGRVHGFAGQEELWKLLAGPLELHAIPEEGAYRMRELMARYRDVPMDFADASLVVAAEDLKERRIFTFDSHFQAYRIGEKNMFEIVP